MKINFKNCLLYIIFAACCLFLNGAVDGVPLSFCLYFPMLICGGNAIASPLIYIICSAVHFNLTSTLCAVFEGLFTLAIVLVYRHTGRKIRYEAAAYACVALAPYIIFAEWGGIQADILGSNPYIYKGIAAGVVLIFCLFGYRALFACIFRLGRCRLKEDELASAAALYAATGFGAINLTGQFAYLIFCALALTACIRFFKSPSAIICSAVFSAPLCLYSLDLTPLTAYIIICLFALVFCRVGRAAVPPAVCAAMGGYCYLAGHFAGDTALIIIKAVILVICTLLSALPSEKFYKKMRDKITLKKQLTDTAVNRERQRTGERIFRISQVFREIECAFREMDEATDDYAVKKRIFTELRTKCCKDCDRRQKCEQSPVYTGIGKLIDAGTIKGKITIIDLPPDVTRNCSRPADLISQLNNLLAEYRRYMTEAENARSGRILLADQAKGVSLVLKSCAVELCKRARVNGEDEQRIKDNLAVYGITCPELYLNCEDNTEVGAVIVGKARAATAIRAIEQVTGGPLELKDKICYDDDKFCYIFCKQPRYDAVFGVATIKKNGEKASGDTHSVIRINEHKFLMALSDGMGSGEYARKVSATAISLIEAFYKAEMPEGTVLDTINKLISFSRDERFTCIDICSVDLNTGWAEFVKIGSPIAVIMGKTEIKIIESESLPLGILDDLRPTVAREQLKDGDFLIFMSDGITGAFNSTPELVEFLQPIKPLNPQNLADAILKGAEERYGGDAQDDMTVLCVRIFTTAVYGG